MKKWMQKFARIWAAVSKNYFLVKLWHRFEILPNDKEISKPIMNKDSRLLCK